MEQIEQKKYIVFWPFWNNHKLELYSYCFLLFNIKITSELIVIFLKYKSRTRLLKYYINKARYIYVLTGVKYVMKMEDTESFKSIGAKLSRRHHPLCKEHSWGSDDYWGCYIRESILTMYHPTSTCKMGPVKEQSTVVDSKLR